VRLPSTVRFPSHHYGGGRLSVYEAGKTVPFDIKRVFTVSAPAGQARGNHAHRKCTQLLVCVSGSIRVTCDDGTTVSNHLLDSTGTGLLVPPGIWSKQDYLSDDTTLMVLCDHVYEDEDYIRDYDDFKKFCSKAR
jgi:dTDP-4-dehydrorhamnose 3,5-epimerase-like enzyme